MPSGQNDLRFQSILHKRVHEFIPVSYIYEPTGRWLVILSSGSVVFITIILAIFVITNLIASICVPLFCIGFCFPPVYRAVKSSNVFIDAETLIIEGLYGRVMKKSVHELTHVKRTSGFFLSQLSFTDGTRISFVPGDWVRRMSYLSERQGFEYVSNLRYKFPYSYSSEFIHDYDYYLESVLNSKKNVTDTSETHD